MSNIDALPSSLIARLPPALAALLAHLPGLALAALLIVSGLGLTEFLLAALIGFIAFTLAMLWKLPVWWRWINLLFTPTLFLALSAGLDNRWYLAGFLVLALTSLGSLRTRVPLYLSSRAAARELALRLPQGGLLCDLGCGLGDPLCRVRAARPDARLMGVEAAPFNWLVARLRLLGRADIRLGSLWSADLSCCDVVYAYLSPAPMARLWDKASREMKPGSLFISNSFSAPGLTFHEVVELNDLTRSRLLIRKM